MAALALSWMTVRRAPTRVVITVVAALAIGSQLDVVRAYVAPGRLVTVAPVVLVIGILFKVHPRWTVAALLAGSLLGFYTTSIAFGPLDLRITDVPYAALVLWVVVLKDRGRTVRPADVGQQQLAILLVVLAVSLVPVFRTVPADFLSGMVSWLRLVQTLSLIWLVPFAVTDDDDRRFVLHTVCVVALIEIAMALWEFRIEVGLFDLTQRLDGPIGPNATGLLGGLLLAFALHSPFTPRRVKFVFGSVGALALVMSQSVGALASVALTLACFGLRWSRRRPDRRRDALVRPARLLLLVFGVLAVVATLRPSNLPTSEKFRQSTTAHRTILGLAGVQLFRNDPWLGVGWQRSSLPHVIGDPEISARLREQFEGANEVFFPDLYAGSVHNAYIQFAAEAGLVGLAALALTAVGIKRGATRLLHASGVDRATVRVTVVGLTVVLIWWNDNALFGAQPETVLAGVFLGLLASFGVQSRPARRIPGLPSVQLTPVGARPGAAADD